MSAFRGQFGWVVPQMHKLRPGHLLRNPLIPDRLLPRVLYDARLSRQVTCIIQDVGRLIFGMPRYVSDQPLLAV